MVLLACMLGIGGGVFAAPATGPAQLEATPRQFRAGAATSNITPRLGTSINGYFADRLAAHVHDELHARCLVLDDGQMAMAIADDPAIVFCIQPFTSVERDGGEKLGKLLARVTGDPDHALLVATGTAFVFAFSKDQPGQGESAGMRDDGATEAPS